ncbi:MAG: sigma-70 family RNA polymerase sigma factor [Actinobacteria bacterium]|nr:MAG: sigma-70 family RNA polymerase sigma factor [Actinomycetota bacterium]
MSDRGEGGVISLRGRRRERSQTARELAHLSDEAVLALIARADDQALAELYRRFGRLAYGLAFRILRDDALAQDAVQDAFLGVWRAAGRFTAERSKPSTWLLTLVHRRAVDLVRREERRRTEPLQPESEFAGGEAAVEAELATRRQTIREALRQLPSEQREAIELAYYGGYTQSELAERLGQPLGTIKSRMFTGLARLRDTLGEDARAQFGPG